MSFLEISGKTSRNSKSRKWLAVFAAIVLVLAGRTLASNISLNGGENVEFGMGVVQTVFCGGDDAEVMVTPYTSFVNADSGDGGGQFSFTDIKLSDIPEDCQGKSFRFRAYDGSGQNVSLSSCADDGLSISVYFNGDDSSTEVTDLSQSDFGSDVAAVTARNESMFNLSWNGACDGLPVDSSNIYRITVESFDGPAPSDGGGDGDVIGDFTFIDCSSNTAAPCRLYGQALSASVSGVNFVDTYNAVENSGPLLRECPAGYAVVGIKAGDASYVGEISPICAVYPSKSVEHQFLTWSLENPGYLVGDVTYIKEERCSGTDSWVVGFGGRAGAINDAMQILCKTPNGNADSAVLGSLLGGMGGGQIDSKRCVVGEVVTGVWVWGLNNQFTGWGGAGGGQGVAFRCTKASEI